MSARARLLAACAAVVLALGLTGCGGADAPSTGTSTASASLRGIPADRLRQRVVEAGRLAVRTLGTTPWRLTGDGAERCSLDGERGMRFGWTAGGPPSDDVVRDGEAVAAAYRHAGFDVRTQRSADGVAMRVVGTRADVGVVELDAATDSTAVDVGSVCIAGDPLAYNRTATPSPPISG